MTIATATYEGPEGGRVKEFTTQEYPETPTMHLNDAYTYIADVAEKERFVGERVASMRLGGRRDGEDVR